MSDPFGDFGVEMEGVRKAARNVDTVGQLARYVYDRASAYVGADHETVTVQLFINALEAWKPTTTRPAPSAEDSEARFVRTIVCSACAMENDEPLACDSPNCDGQPRFVTAEQVVRAPQEGPRDTASEAKTERCRLCEKYLEGLWAHSVDGLCILCRGAWATEPEETT
jgi:hypothetical protein